MSKEEGLLIRKLRRRRVVEGKADEAPVFPSDLLTPEEQHAMGMITDVFNYMSQNVIGSNPVARAADMPELAMHIHDLQRMVMSQAACRAFPEKYRLLGELGSWHEEKDE